MRASAAWLALWNKQVRDELVRREPLLLIRNGDPASLQVDAKKALLKQIGEKPQLGREARTYIEQRLIVMFADPVLSDDVHVAWAKATDEEIQSLLLNIVASGRIANGAMIGQAALHGEWNVRVQVDAVESLLGCGDTSTLQHFANQFYAQLPQYSSHAIGAITARLFPEYLSPAQLVTALQDTDANETWNLQDYWFRCRNDDERESLMNALADSCLTPPVDKHYGINKERKELARRCARMLRKIYQRDGTLHNSKGLRRLLVVVARVRIEYGDEENLQSMIQADRGLKRDVFWEHVQVVRETREEPEKELDRLSFFYNQQFWSFDQDDVPWLLDELTTRTSADDRQVLLRAIWTTLAPRNEFAAAEKDVRAIIHDDASLQAQLNDYLRPPSPDTEREIEEHRQEMERHQQRMRSKKKAQQQQLTEFRDRLVADPGLLTRDISEGGDGESMRLLLRLDEWFTQAADEDWQQFRDAFGADVVDAYREGMRLHWITTPPRAPVRTGSGTRNVFWSQVLANRALDMEAKSTPGWAATLTTAEARRAAEHVCIGAGTHPEWFPKLLAAHSKEVAAPLEDMIENDWRTSQIDREGFLTHYAWTSEELPDFLQQLLVDTMLQIPPHTSDQLHQCASLIPRCQSVSNLTQLLPLLEEVLGGININDANDLQRGAYCLAAISRLDVDQAISTLLEWLHGLANAGTNELAIGLLASLFSRMRNGPTI
ncbi:MAG: hypothetical protein KY410_10410, partial [Proteobacteria bacterium]|nr:hypothetical protein [Pseudomonadota bacterium]